MSVNLTKLVGSRRPLIMGVLNVTPDSFSDGGKYDNLKQAVWRAKQLIDQGVDIIDIGGESTGPNSKAVSYQEEARRVLPVISEINKKIKKRSKILISVDTYKSEIAKRALASGADIINDVTGLRGDVNMAKVVAEYNCPVVIMYSKDNTARTTIKKMQYRNVVKTINNFFTARIRYASKNSVAKKNIILDPGMGHFISAVPAYSYEVISRLNEFKKLGCQVMLGMSRKSFLGGELNERDQKVLPLLAVAYFNGVSIIRTHDVLGTIKFYNLLNK
ncbi:MAG: dihydropteroate synthase [Patescibacteria group bacterium]